MEIVVVVVVVAIKAVIVVLTTVGMAAIMRATEDKEAVVLEVMEEATAAVKGEAAIVAVKAGVEVIVVRYNLLTSTLDSFRYLGESTLLWFARKSSLYSSWLTQLFPRL